MTTSVGTRELRVPRARVRDEETGETTEFKSELLPRYARRTREVDEAILGTYLSGANSRRVRRALKPLLGEEHLSKSAVSRVVSRLKERFEEWQSRDLSDEVYAIVYLDGFHLKVRMAKRVISVPVLAALGVAPDGQKRLLSLRLAVSESSTHWGSALEGLQALGLRAPKLVISDGHKGLTKALEKWPECRLQRCTEHKRANLLEQCPAHARRELRRDYNRIVYSKNGIDARKAYDKLVAKWTPLAPAVVRSLEEAGNQLLTFYEFPRAMWKSIRTTTFHSSSDAPAPAQRRSDRHLVRAPEPILSENANGAARSNPRGVLKTRGDQPTRYWLCDRRARADPSCRPSVPSNWRARTPLLCGVAVVIAEQAAQSLTTSHLPVRTADAFFRFEQRVPTPLMVALSVIMMDELSDGTTQRWLTEEDHPLQALALDRQNKPFDVSVQIRRTVRQPHDVRSGVLEQIAKLRGELLVAVQDEESLAAQKAVEWVGEIPTDLHHERAIRPRSYSGNVHFSRRQLDDDEHIVGHEPANCGDLDGEEVCRSNGFPMGGEKRAPWRSLTSLRRGLDAMFSQNIGDGAPGYDMAEIREGAANACIPRPRIRLRHPYDKLANLGHDPGPSAALALR